MTFAINWQTSKEREREWEKNGNDESSHLIEQQQQQKRQFQQKNNANDENMLLIIVVLIRRGLAAFFLKIHLHVIFHRKYYFIVWPDPS